MIISADDVRARDGIRLSYTLRQDRDDAKPVVLLHSLGLDRGVWDGVVERLAPGAAVLTFDARGHGASEKPAGPYTVEQFADDLADLLDAVGWRSATVAGSSMGGCVALAFASAHPARTDGLVLIDTTAWYGSGAVDAWEERAAKAQREGLGAMVGFQTTRWFSDRFRAEQSETVDRYVARFLENDVAAYAASCRMLGACDVRAGLAKIAVPAAIVVGEEDYATPVAMAEALHGAIAGSSLTVIEGARHLTPIEVPERVAGEIARLLAAVPAH